MHFDAYTALCPLENSRKKSDAKFFLQSTVSKDKYPSFTSTEKREITIALIIRYILMEENNFPST